jgi:DNA excision repair protein ERCC-2
MAIRFKDDERCLSLSVRDLLERADPRGDLQVGGLAGTARMAIGRAVHEDEQAARMDEESAYDAEVTVRYTVVVQGWECTIRGRIDGLMQSDEGVLVEEIKSTLLPGEVIERSTAADWPAWSGQVSLYVWILNSCGKGPASGQLVVISVADGTRVLLPVDVSTEALTALVEDRLGRLVSERMDWLAWKKTRATGQVPFAHPQTREGQSDIAREALDAVERGQQLLLSAPTGTGKTAAVLQGVLESAARQGFRVFYATSKGTQREMVERTVAEMVARGLPIRAVSLTAREKLCLKDVVDCRPQVCAYAEGHFDRLHQGEVIPKSLAESVLPAARLKIIGQKECLCPHALGTDLAGRADLVVGDYNYVFDPQMASSWLANDWDKWVVIVDEAHNLVERARGYGSPRLNAALAYEAEFWLADTYGRGSSIHGQFCHDLAVLIESCWVDSDLEKPGEWECELPESDLLALKERSHSLGLHYALMRARHPVNEDPYQDLLRAFSLFLKVCEDAGEESLRLYGMSRAEGSWIRLLCLDPSRLMRKRFERFESAVLMSATLQPWAYHTDLLGLDPERLVLSAHASPFPSHNRGVFLATRVSTTFRDRAAHRERTGALLKSILAASPGHRAVYYPSYAMLKSLAPLCEVAGSSSLIQSAKMTEAQRADFIAQLQDDEIPKVLHAVLGGLFSEGIDLPKGRLKTVAVVGPALPPIGVERDRIRQWCEMRYQEGFSYAFLVPGMSKVVQAAGRVVRSAEERGAVVLVGRRFGWRDYRDLLPKEWEVERVEDAAAAVSEFWQAEQAPL